MVVPATGNNMEMFPALFLTQKDEHLRNLQGFFLNIRKRPIFYHYSYYSEHIYTGIVTLFFFIFKK